MSIPVGGGPLDGLRNLLPSLKAPSFQCQGAQRLPPWFNEPTVLHVLSLAIGSHYLGCLLPCWEGLLLLVRAAHPPFPMISDVGTAGTHRSLSHAGQTHLNAPKDLEEIGDVPAGLLAPPLDAAPLGLGMLEQVERNVAQHGEVLGGVPGPDAALVLMKADIKDPMNAVFDAPMTANRLAKGKR